MGYCSYMDVLELDGPRGPPGPPGTFFEPALPQFRAGVAGSKTVEGPANVRCGPDLRSSVVLEPGTGRAAGHGSLP